MNGRSTAGRFATAAAALACGALIAACGDDEEVDLTAPYDPTPVEFADPGEPEGAPRPDAPGLSDEDVIRAAIEDFYVSGDPRAACEQAATDVFIRRAYGDQQGCRAAVGAPGAAADAVRTRAIEIDGDRAGAVAVPRGGPSDGIELEVELILQGDRWRINDVGADVPPGP